MKDFIEHVQKSIYAPDYYRKIISEKKAFSLKYYFGLVLALSLLLTVLISVPIIVKVPQFLRDGAASTIAYFPDELELRITNGIVSSNVTEPYYLPFPNFLKEENITLPSANLFVIDTSAEFSLEKFTAQKAYFWLGKNFIAYTDDVGGVKIQRIDPGVNYALNKVMVRNFVSQVTPYFWIVPPAMFALMFIAFFLMNVAQLLYLFFAAILIYALLRYLKKNVSYWNAYQLGVHALTLPILLNSALILFSFSLTQLPFMQTIILLAVIYMNFREEDALTPPIAPGTVQDTPGMTPEK